MKLTSFFASSSERVPTKTKAKTSVTTLLAALILTGVLPTSSGIAPEINAESLVVMESEPLGLSRNRPAFNKALDMLADAAATDSRLAAYNEAVSTRVKGHPTQQRNRGVVHAVRRVKSARGDVPTSQRHTQMNTAPPTATTKNPPLVLTVGDMAFQTNPEIEQWVSYYTQSPVGRRTMTIGVERSNSYLEMARAEFKSAGVPEDLVWLAFVESVWNPQAVSPAAAGGIWQFIPSTASEYGLVVERGNDERTDPIKQTRVAAAYLRDLYTIFGDWGLAMAAYNSGEPRVMGAIVKNGRASFWDLYHKLLLPKETRDYVPKILAAIKVASRAEELGLAPSEADSFIGS